MRNILLKDDIVDNLDSNASDQPLSARMGKYLLGKLTKPLFPVGAVYISTTSVNPSKYFGGTWELFAQGRTLVGAGTGNDGSTSMSFTANSEIGEYTHLLSWQEMPPHSHYQNIVAFGYQGWDGFTTNGYCGMVDYNSSAYHAPGKNLKVAKVGMETYTNEAGLGKTHNNIQPSKVVYMWHRNS